MKPFKRRTYRSPGQLLHDIRTATRKRGEMRSLMHGETLAAAFRERLMLAVTEVNQCRYCAYYHAKQALVEGLSESELQSLTEGEFDNSPTEERPALLYAQHWTEADGSPDEEARARIDELYGAETADAIDLALRVIPIGNLLGNTWDGLLYRLSLGRWGTTEA
ncbi:MAG: carboxymuconolactone decarboxylase family protein [Anaerolineae bacterium]|nr:carboxymuconolactone decarboxylase family protein [Anaerolineae bacterium]